MRQLGDYIAAHYGGKIDILYGISYGCRVLMEVLADKRLTITTTIADGMGLRDYPNIKSKWGKNIYCFFYTGLFYAIMGHPGPRRKKFLAKVTGRTLEEADRILYGKATWRSWKNQDYGLIGKKPTIPCLKELICSYGTGSRAVWIKSCRQGLKP